MPALSCVARVHKICGVVHHRSGRPRAAGREPDAPCRPPVPGHDMLCGQQAGLTGRVGDTAAGIASRACISPVRFMSTARDQRVLTARDPTLVRRRSIERMSLRNARAAPFRATPETIPIAMTLPSRWALALRRRSITAGRTGWTPTRSPPPGDRCIPAIDASRTASGSSTSSAVTAVGRWRSKGDPCRAPPPSGSYPLVTLDSDILVVRRSRPRRVAP